MNIATIQTTTANALLGTVELPLGFWLGTAVIIALMVIPIDNVMSIASRFLNALKSGSTLSIPNHFRPEIVCDEVVSTPRQKLTFFFWFWTWKMFVDPVGRVGTFFATAAVPVTYLSVTYSWQEFMALSCGMYIAVYAMMPFAGLLSAIACALVLGFVSFDCSPYMFLYVPTFVVQCRMLKSLARVLGCRPQQGCQWHPIYFGVVATLAIAVSGIVLVETEMVLSFFTSRFCSMSVGELWLRVVLKCSLGTAIAAPFFWILCWFSTGEHIFSMNTEVE